MPEFNKGGWLPSDKQPPTIVHAGEWVIRAAEHPRGK